MTTRSTSGDSKAARTRTRILRVAAREIAHRGYGGTSLRLIASESDLQLGSLYFHFSSKDELVAEVLRDGVNAALDKVAEATDSLPADATADVRLRAAMRAHLNALHASHDRSAAVVWMIETMPSEIRRKHRRDARRYSQWWLSMLSELQQRGDIRADVDAEVAGDIIVGSLNTTLSRTRGADEGHRGAVIDALASMLLGRAVG